MCDQVKTMTHYLEIILACMLLICHSEHWNTINNHSCIGTATKTQISAMSFSNRDFWRKYTKFWHWILLLLLLFYYVFSLLVKKCITLSHFNSQKETEGMIAASEKKNTFQCTYGNLTSENMNLNSFHCRIKCSHCKPLRVCTKFQIARPDRQQLTLIWLLCNLCK